MPKFLDILLARFDQFVDAFPEAYFPKFFEIPEAEVPIRDPDRLLMNAPALYNQKALLQALKEGDAELEAAIRKARQAHSKGIMNYVLSPPPPCKYVSTLGMELSGQQISEVVHFAPVLIKPEFQSNISTTEQKEKGEKI